MLQKFEPLRRSVLSMAAWLTPLGFLGACRSVDYGDALYRLQLASGGKDVMWMPSSEAISMAMLKAADTRSSDVVYDLGSGDGIIPILAAKHFGASAVGVEYNPDLVALSRRNAMRAGVADKTRFVEADLFTVDFSEASIVTMYLGEAINLKLLPRLEALRAGTKIVSNRFDLGSWQPDLRIIDVPDELAMLWVVPARLQGRWRINPRLGLGTEQVDIIQSHQMIELRTVRPGTLNWVGEGRIRGRHVDMVFHRSEGSPLRVKAQLTPDAKQMRLSPEQNIADALGVSCSSQALMGLKQCLGETYFLER